MFKNILRRFFVKQKKAESKPLTIINQNRKSIEVKRTILYKRNEEREKTCLSKYFSNIRGLNTIERNIYSKVI